MFSALRKMILPIIIIVLFFFMGMIVLEWGLGMSSRSDYVGSNAAAVINGEEVSWQEYNRVFSMLLRTEADKSEEELPDAQVKQIQQDAWNQILQDRLIMQQVAKHKLTVTEEELYGYLRMSPPQELQQTQYFQTEGKFDYQKYVNAMADPQMAPYWSSLEPHIRNEILKLKLQEAVVQAAHITEAEVRDHFIVSTERIKAGMINVTYARFSRPPPKFTDEENRAYFAEHKDEYTVADRAALSLVKIEKKPSPLDWERVYIRSKQIYDSLVAGADFAEMAGFYSEDGSGKDGGDLGWFAQGRMVPEFDELSFSMKEGELSEPLRTQFGWHILKHHGYKEEMEDVAGKEKKEKVKKAHVSHILLKVATSEETLDRSFNTLNEFQAAARDQGFAEAAKSMNLVVEETGLFVRNGNILYLGADRATSDFAFENKIADISEVMENATDLFVIRLDERRPAGPATYEDMGEKVKMDIVKSAVAQMCRDTANAIWAELQSGANPRDAAKKFDAEYSVPEEFRRDSYIKGYGRGPSGIGAVFSLTEPGQWTGPVDHDKGTVMFELIGRKSADISEFTEQRDSLRTILLQNKQQQCYGRWYQHLVETSDIENNVEKNQRRSDYM